MVDMTYLIGIDIGTSATKIIIMNENGKIFASVSKNYKLIKPKNGWAEQDPEDWKNAVLEGLTEALRNAALKKEDIKGIGLTGQMHGIVMLDEEGVPLRKSIIWCDQRSDEQVRQMLKIMPEEEWLRITGNPPIAAWSAAKILWIKQYEPEIYQRCKHILLPKDYIRYVLTGEFATDVSDASGTQLLNVAARKWSKEVLDKLEIDRTLLPNVYESQEVTGNITAPIGKLIGLSADTVVVAGASDNAGAAIGMGAVEEDIAFVTLGTSAIIYTHLNEYRAIPEGSLHICCSAVKGCWHTMGGPQAAGLSLQWFIENFCHAYMDEAEKEKKGVFDVINHEVTNVPIGSNRLIYMPYLMGERTPHMNPDCRGVFFGLNVVHTKANLLRAVMEGVGYSMADCSEILKQVGIHIKAIRACGGGSKSKVWKQIIADILNCDLVTMNQEEGPAFGAAILAGVGVGIYKDVKMACQNLLVEKQYVHSIKENNQVYQSYHQLYTGLYIDTKKHFTELALLK